MHNINFSKIVFIFFLFVLLSKTNAQDYTSFNYFKNDSISLKLDVFFPDTTKQEALPLFIYVHGGGFKSGKRTAGHDICRYLSKNGIVAATISYTLYMKDKDFGCNGQLTEKIKAIQIAVNQLWIATNYFIDNANKFKIEKNQIIIGGSSAGAEVTWHAAYWDRKLMTLFKHELPNDFKYAGLVNSSGAIMDLNLITKHNSIPAMLAHGDKDRIVPYGTAAHHYCKHNASGWLMLFGSHSIYEHLIGCDEHAELFTYKNQGHGCYNWIFKKEPNLVDDFIKRAVSGSDQQFHKILDNK